MMKQSGHECVREWSRSAVQLQRGVYPCGKISRTLSGALLDGDDVGVRVNYTRVLHGVGGGRAASAAHEYTE